MAQASMVHQRGNAVADGVVDSPDLEQQVCLASIALSKTQACVHAANFFVVYGTHVHQITAGTQSCGQQQTLVYA